MPVKQIVITRYIQSFQARQSSGRLCILTAYADVANEYVALLRCQGYQPGLYGFGETPTLTDETIVICSIAAYDRAVYTHCTELLVTDLDRDKQGLSRVLYSQKRPIVIVVMRGCSDDLLFREWCS
jgi:uncharacterized Rossmann fold enzyme